VISLLVGFLYFFFIDRLFVLILDWIARDLLFRVPKFDDLTLFLSRKPRADWKSSLDPDPCFSALRIASSGLTIGAEIRFV